MTHFKMNLKGHVFVCLFVFEVGLCEVLTRTYPQPSQLKPHQISVQMNAVRNRCIYILSPSSMMQHTLCSCTHVNVDTRGVNNCSKVKYILFLMVQMSSYMALIVISLAVSLAPHQSVRAVTTV